MKDEGSGVKDRRPTAIPIGSAWGEGEGEGEPTAIPIGRDVLAHEQTDVMRGDGHPDAVVRAAGERCGWEWCEENPDTLYGRIMKMIRQAKQEREQEDCRQGRRGQEARMTLSTCS